MIIGMAPMALGLGEGGENRVVLKMVTIAPDMARTVEIGSGLTAQDCVIESPRSGIATGDEVQVANAPARGGTPEAEAKQRQRPPS
jgi:NADPH-dependent glutamate synthase beta subunit-like oxidoreductase